VSPILRRRRSAVYAPPRPVIWWITRSMQIGGEMSTFFIPHGQRERVNGGRCRKQRRFDVDPMARSLNRTHGRWGAKSNTGASEVVTSFIHSLSHSTRANHWGTCEAQSPNPGWYPCLCATACRPRSIPMDGSRPELLKHHGADTVQPTEGDVAHATAIRKRPELPLI